MVSGLLATLPLLLLLLFFLFCFDFFFLGKIEMFGRMFHLLKKKSGATSTGKMYSSQ
jgi:hypothetical protein